jgi:hypothetical protein
VSAPFWVAELANDFWEAAGMREPFPRFLRVPIARALTVSVTALPRLHLGGVRAWLVDGGMNWPCPVADRRLRACLVARCGWGYVFLDEADAEDEQRFSLAHELAHFLRHYWQPRRDAVRRLGPAILEVFDGRRAPTAAEQLQALLSGSQFGFHVHLMERDAGGRPVTEAVRLAEEEADRLAFELLAPAAEVLVCAGSSRGTPDREQVAPLLHETFGLPALQAARYAEALLPAPADDPLLRRLGLSR